jgi:3-isopropylmalate/(R)-2-methylmalate dehydratase large subunit
MGKTLSQKILAKASKKNSVETGELVWANVNILMTHDPCSPGVIGVFKREFGENAKVWDTDKHIMIPDHFIFTADNKANANVRLMREFAKEQELRYFYDAGTKDYKGVCHIALAQEGHNRPGEILVGTDSHTVTSGAFGTFAIGVGNTDAAFILGTGEIPLKVPPTIKIIFNGNLPPYLMAKDLILQVLSDLTTKGATYCAIEFAGEVIDNMSVEERMTLCNMTVECGAKNGIMVPNEATLKYLEKRNHIPFEVFTPDNDAEYFKVLEYDVSHMQPLVAKPHSPDNVDEVDLVEGTSLNRAYIGSCTGGKLTDFLAAAKILNGQQVTIDTFAVPATREVLDEIIMTKIDNKSIYEIMIDAGVKVSTETSCAACCGGPADTFGRINEPLSTISTTNRNFLGRMGSKQAQIYLASPYTVAASAIAGNIANPKDCLG